MDSCIQEIMYLDSGTCGGYRCPALAARTAWRGRWIRGDPGRRSLQPTIEIAKQAPQGELRSFPIGDEQIAFLRRTLGEQLRPEVNNHDIHQGPHRSLESLLG
jgi:hypothetical protein